MIDCTRKSVSEPAALTGAIVLRLHPAGFTEAAVPLRSWMVFHSRLPSLVRPDEEDGRGTVEVRVGPGDHWCHAVERIRTAGRRRHGKLTVQVVELPLVEPDRTWVRESVPRVRLTEITVPVLLHARVTGRADGGNTAPRRFLNHVRALEADHLDPSQLRPAFWAHVAAAVEMRQPLPWPSATDSVNETGGRQ